MAGEGIHVESFLVAVALMIVGAFFGSLVFRRFRVPDIVFLIGLGMVLGPVTHFVSVDVFRAIAPLAGTVALIIILFDGGLEIRLQEIVHGVASGGLLGLIVFLATTLLCAAAAHFVGGFAWPYALLLGMALGGAGAVIVIPLIQELGVTERSQTIVSIEAATSDVLVVVGVVGLSTVLSLQESDPAKLTRNLVQTFAVGILAGAIVGALWGRGLKRFTERSYEYVLTMAVLFLLYAITEQLGGSGALAVLSFGLVLGNTRKVEKIRGEVGRRSARNWRYAPVFHADLRNLHQEMVFFIRAFFFVALGVIINPELVFTPRFLGLGLLLSLGVILGRFWGVYLLFGRARLSEWDRMAVTLMFPLGLAAAALSIVPFQRFGLEAARDLGSYAAVVILLTNLISSVAVFIVSTDRVRLRFEGAPDDEASSRERGRGAPD